MVQLTVNLHISNQKKRKLHINISKHNCTAFSMLKATILTSKNVYNKTFKSPQVRYNFLVCRSNQGHHCLDNKISNFMREVVKRFSKIRISNLFIVLVFDLQKSNIVSNTAL